MMHVRWKRTLASACLALTMTASLSGLAVGAVGLAHAQVDPTPGTSSTTPGRAHHARGGAMFGAAAQAIGITPQELHQELPGKSLAQVAESHGKTGAEVAAALKTADDARIDKLVNRVVPVRSQS
jgi:hypothetical protein